MLRSRFISDSERLLLRRVCFPRSTTSETIASLKSLLSTWCSLRRSGGLRESLSCTAGSMLWTLRLSTSACRSFAGQSSGVRSRASRSIRRWISSRRFPCSTGLTIPTCMMSTPWTGSRTSCWHAMSLTEATLTSSDTINIY